MDGGIFCLFSAARTVNLLPGNADKNNKTTATFPLVPLVFVVSAGCWNLTANVQRLKKWNIEKWPAPDAAVNFKTAQSSLGGAKWGRYLGREQQGFFFGFFMKKKTQLLLTLARSQVRCPSRKLVRGVKIKVTVLHWNRGTMVGSSEWSKGIFEDLDGSRKGILLCVLCHKRI